MKQSMPTKLFAWLACLSGGTGTIASVVAVCAGVFFLFHQRGQSTEGLFTLSSLALIFIGYTLAFNAAMLAIGVVILRRSARALQLVVAAGLWQLADTGMWTRIYDASPSYYVPRTALVALFLAWMILRREELTQKETQQDESTLSPLRAEA